jgi:hypothetical protein
MRSFLNSSSYDYALQAVEIGGSFTDVYVLNEERTEVLGIPNIVLIQDMYSGFITGFDISMESVGTSSFERAIQHSLKYGKPDKIICPKKYDIEYICEKLGIHHDLNITRRMNRFFKTIRDDLFDRISGSTSILKYNRRANPQKKAVFTIEDLNHFVEEWLKVYQMQWHSALWDMPEDLFEEGLRKKEKAT